MSNKNREREIERRGGEKNDKRKKTEMFWMKERKREILKSNAEDKRKTERLTVKDRKRKCKRKREKKTE